MPNKNEFELASELALSKIQSGNQPSDEEFAALRLRFPFYLQCVFGKGDPDLPTNQGELEDKAEIADHMIREIEAGVASLRDKMMSVTADIPSHVLSPLNRIERNAGNPMRNKYALRLAALNKRLSQHPIPADSFFYMLSGEQRQHSAAASFRESDRTLFVPEEFSRESKLDCIVACHEAVHVGQDDAARSAITNVSQAMQYEERLRFLSEGKRVVINGELPAYGREIQIANYVLGRAFQNPNAMSEEELIEKLGANRPDQQIIARTLLRLARAFPNFENHQPNQVFPASYAEEVIDMYRSNEFEIYAQDPYSGQLRQI
ncbi:MAG: hypothetical protein K9M03_02340 [Kiritimatiellales bacterium]|nr:hypothetical protein [Kiritimatiellales bacterium]